MDAIWFFVGSVLFLAVFGFALRRWWGELADITPAARLTLIATTVGGLIGAVFWWLDADASFAWQLAPMASRMLGAAATAFGLTGLFVLMRPTRERARLHALMTAVYLLPLAVMIVLLHLDRFDYGAPVTWAFFATVGVLIVSSVAGLLTERPMTVTAATVEGPAMWHLVAGCLLGLWGLALMLFPAAPYPLIFNWPADALTSRLIGSMLLTIGVVFLSARGRPSLAPQADLFAAVYGVGVVVAVTINLVGGLSWPPAYLVSFGLIGCISAAFFWTQGRSTT